MIQRRGLQVNKLNLNAINAESASDDQASIINDYNLTNRAEIKISDETKISVEWDNLKCLQYLGEGQCGEVLKMIDEPSNMVFAVKKIPDEKMRRKSPTSMNAEAMDLTVLTKVDNKCPFLIKYYGALHAEGCVWLLTEIMDLSLDKLHSKMTALSVPMPELFLSKIAYAVVNALAYMKSLKLMHRDIKPSNLLINSTGEIKVCDFGITGIIINSLCNSILGCHAYLAPERTCEGEKGRGYSVKADIWSLGISLIEIATGTHPYASCKRTCILMGTILQDDPPRLDPGKFSPEFCQFIEKCLIKDPKQRSTCQELLNEKFITDHLNHAIDLEMLWRVING